MKPQDSVYRSVRVMTALCPRHSCNVMGLRKMDDLIENAILAGLFPNDCKVTYTPARSAKHRGRRSEISVSRLLDAVTSIDGDVTRQSRQTVLYMLQLQQISTILLQRRMTLIEKFWASRVKFTLRLN